MASISTDKNGNRRILFVDGDGKRQTIYAGKLPLKQAETVKVRVEQLLGSKLSGGGWAADLAKWVATLGDELAGKLAAVGLIPKRTRSTLKAFVDSYAEERKADVKPGTVANLKHAAGFMLEFFGDDKRLQDITLGDADSFRRWLESKVGANTARRLLGRAKQFFRAATRKKFIDESPFADMKGLAVQANKAREFFVTPATAARVIEACPSNEWRLIFALARWGGLRVPSELQGLRWGDIDWARDRFMVRSPKTEHHEGGDSRWVPIFPELRPQLEAAFEQAIEGAEFVIGDVRRSKTNLRTHMRRIIQRAGITPWAKPFQNCRSTRETELAETFPIHVVCEWIGNSEVVAKKHYLQTTEDHFAKATRNPTQTVAGDARQGATIENEKPQITGVSA